MLKNLRHLKGGTCAVLAATLCTVLPLAAQTPPPSDPSVALSHSAGPFFRKNCQTCHNANLPSGSIDLEELLATPNSLRDRFDTWQDVAFQLRSGQMPPQGAPRPSRADVDAALEVISRAIAAAPRFAAPAPPAKEPPPTTDWLTFSFDPARTGWARVEKKISKSTAPSLHLLWKLQTDTVPTPVNVYSTLTDAVVVNNVATREGAKKLVFVGSRDNSIYAIDAEKGSVFWKKSFTNTAKPPVAANGQCPENQNATPVVDREKGILYFLPNDGKLRGVNLADGEERFPATRIVPAFSRNFSLNLVDGRIVTSTTRGCANAASQIVVMDVNDPEHPVEHFFTSTGKGSGVWGRGGIVRSPFGWLAQTADGAFDPASGRFANSVVSLTPDGMLTDSFTPPNQDEIDARDLDLGSGSPVVFPFDDRTLVAAAGKEGLIYLLDAKSLGGEDHRTALYTSPRWSNDTQYFGFNGMWSVMSTYVDGRGKRWLLVPFYGPPAKATVGLFKKSHGPAVNGELMAFTVEGTGAHPTLQPQWISGDLDLPGVAVVANGVILILANGDRGATLVPGVRLPPSGGGPDRPGGPPDPAAHLGPRPILARDANPSEPGFERDAAWKTAQMRPFEEGGAKPGHRFSGCRDTTHAVLYALDPETGDEIYSSGDAMDSWNHYGGLALSDGNIYVTTWDARVFAFGVAAEK